MNCSWRSKEPTLAPKPEERLPISFSVDLARFGFRPDAMIAMRSMNSENIKDSPRWSNRLADHRTDRARSRYRTQSSDDASQYPLTTFRGISTTPYATPFTTRTPSSLLWSRNLGLNITQDRIVEMAFLIHPDGRKNACIAWYIQRCPSPQPPQSTRHYRSDGSQSASLPRHW